MSTSLSRLLPVAALAAVLAACSAPTSPSADWTTWEDGYAEYAALAAVEGEVGLAATVEPQRYILSQNGRLRGVDRVAANRGDALVTYLPDAGFAVVETRDASAYARFANVIVPDRVVNWRQPTERVAFEPDAENPPFAGEDDAFFNLQWGHDSVDSPEAWDAGVRGAGVTVAVLDGGFQLDHPDLAANVIGSADMTGEGIAYGPNSDDASGILSHGMHVAGTIGAPDNGIGGIGVAPEVNLLLVKVLFNFGSGSFADVIEGMYYAADNGADIANMSLGADIPRSGDAPGEAREIAGLMTAMQRALNYGTWKGTLYVVAAGNDGRDLDKDADLLAVPAQLARTVTVSSTAPVGWAVDPANADLYNLASYSNFGRSGIDVSAPGGDFSYAFVDPAQGCTVAGLTRPCYVFDFVFSNGALGSYYWSVGTSMAAPHAAGVAALILSERGGSGSMTPAQLQRALEQRAADLGQPGKDPVHGDGAVQSGY